MRPASGGSCRAPPICRVHADASMFVGGLRALLLQSLHPLAMAGIAAAQRLPARPVGSVAAHGGLHRRDHVRPGTGGRAGGRNRAPRPRTRQRRRPRRPGVLGARPAPAAVGAHRRDRQLPRRPHALRRSPARGLRPRRVRGPDRVRRAPARCAGSARVGTCAARPAPFLPVGAARDAARPAKSRSTCSCSHRCRSPLGRPTSCSARQRSPCCRGGPALRCGCPYLPIAERVARATGRRRGHPDAALGAGPPADRAEPD